MQRSMPLRSLSAKYAKVSSTSDWQSNSLESSPSIAARDKTRVAVARSPQGALYAMLADATGHGLAAGVAPLVEKLGVPPESAG